MKVHLTPSIYNQYRHVNVKLIDLSFPDLDLVLKQGVDVVVGKPYPNKAINVVRRKVGRKALNGILVEVPHDIQSFTLITRWAVEAEWLLTHTVNYYLVDSKYDFATQDPAMWYATDDGSQERRMLLKNIIPSFFNARMNVSFDENCPPKSGDVIDCYQGNMLVSRVENYPLPSIKETDLFSSKNSHLARMPDPKDTFCRI